MNIYLDIKITTPFSPDPISLDQYEELLTTYLVFPLSTLGDYNYGSSLQT